MTRRYGVIREWTTYTGRVRRVVVGPYPTKYRAERAIADAYRADLPGKFVVALFRAPAEDDDGTAMDDKP